VIDVPCIFEVGLWRWRPQLIDGAVDDHIPASWPHVVDTQQSSIIKWLEEALPPDKSYDA
jgi:hypothetical protein